MFKIECLVEDKKLPKAAWALDGLVMDLKILPVRGAKVVKEKGSTTVRQVGAGTNQGRFEQAVRDDERKEFTTKELKELVTRTGGNINSASTLIYVLTQRKILKTAGKGHYKRIS